MGQHAALGASSMSRWKACPGSGLYAAQFPNPSSVYAAEGSAAHALAERCLNKGQDPLVSLGQTIQGFEVDREMVAGVQTYVFTVRKEMTRCNWHAIEERVDLAPLYQQAGETAPADLFGTADFMGFRPDTSELVVADLKYGKGVEVEITDNDQLQYYALGAWLSPRVQQDKGAIRHIRIVLVQPRREHVDGPVRTWTIPVLDLMLWAEDTLKPAVAAATAKLPLFEAGGHCRWCPAAGSCKTLARYAMDQAKNEFGEIAPDPVSLNGDELSQALQDAEVINHWLDACRKEAEARLIKGKAVQGWKLVQKRATRYWADILRTKTELERCGIPDIMKVPELRSPAQVEQIMKTTGMSWADIGQIINPLTRAESTGFTLVRESDKRPAIAAGPKADFDEYHEPVTANVVYPWGRQHHVNRTDPGRSLYNNPRVRFAGRAGASHSRD